MNIYSSQKAYFAKAYETGEHGWPVSEPSKSVVRFLETFRRECPSGSVLDMGCGEGRHAALFSQHSYQTIGMDNQPLALKRARHLVRPNHHLYFVLGELFALPFPAHSFDVILDYGLFHHVRKRDTALYLTHVLPVLKSGGYFLLSCFSMKFRHYPGEKRTRDWLVHRGHYDRFFRKDSFKEIFSETFEILSVEEERQALYVFYNVCMKKK